MKPTWMPRLEGIRRRQFLVLAALALGAASGVAAWARKKSGRRAFGAVRIRELALELERLESVAELPLEEAIYRYYDYLKLDSSGVNAFVKANHTSGHPVHQDLITLQQTMSRYLLSTDFFIHGVDESRVVKYVAFHDPHLTPCFTPFS
jgi:hypothetical protein